MTMDVMLGGGRIPIEQEVFVDLFDNSVVNRRKPYLKALDSQTIAFADLVNLARAADIPYSLFFAPHAIVKAQVQAKTAKLLQGITKQTFSLNSRTTVNVSDIELIVKDLVRKQQLLKKHDGTLEKNPIVGMLSKPQASIERSAAALEDALGLDPMAMQSVRSKSAALELLIEHLEARQVLVSRSVNGFMPQSLKGVKFSGITVRDAKVPYVFLAGGTHEDYEEPVGRQIFTLTLLTVLVARGIFAPVTYHGQSVASAPSPEYEIVGQMLMPADQIRDADLSSLDAVKARADQFKVTPSAVTVRALYLRLISEATAHSYLRDLAREFSQRGTSAARRPKAVNAVRRYNGREFSVRMLAALDAGRLSHRNFCREVTLNKLRPSQIAEFREVLR